MSTPRPLGVARWVAFALLAGATLACGAARSSAPDGGTPDRSDQMAAAPALPAQALVCQVRYASETRELRQPASPDPYQAASIDMGERFRLRAVVQGSAERITHITLTVYELGQGDAPVILQQVSHEGPFAEQGAVPSLTGWTHVYASYLGRELVYGCAVQAAQPPATRAVVATVAASAPTQVSSPAASPVVRMVWMGDVMLADGPGQVVAKGGDPFAAVARALAQADVRVANLECVIAQGGQALDKPWTFRAHPRVLPLLSRHVDVVSVANNHAGDYGKQAFAEMLGRLQAAHLPYVGGGRDWREAHRPLIIERQGVRIALLAYDDFFPRVFEAGERLPGVAWAEDAQVAYDIAQARQQADVVIPFMHWGQEHEPLANARQRELARLMIDAGADAVVGSHPHVVQDTEVYRGKPIIYSLGNFVFDGFSSPDNNTGWLLWMDVTRSGVQAWHVDVVHQDRQGSPHPAKGAARAPQSH